MPTPTCPQCRRAIPASDINVAQDVAYCRECNLTHRLSGLTYDGGLGASVDLQHPPAGAWYLSNGGGTVMGVIHRNLMGGFGMLFFTLFWNGIVSVFIAFALAGTLHNLQVPLPGWLPAPRMNNAEMGPGMTLFLWLFLTPFILVGMAVAAACLSLLFGRTEVRIEGTRGTVFTGVGAVGWKRRFDTSEVKDVRMHTIHSRENADSHVILIETREGREIKLGSLLANEKRQFMLGALRRTLLR